METKVIGLICLKLGLDKNEVNNNSHFYQDFNVDRMMMADLILFLEKELAFKMPAKEINNIQTVEELIKAVEQNCDEIL